MKIAITDYSFPSLDIEEGILRPLGHEIASLKERKSAAELTKLVADADAVITQFAPVDAHVIASMQRAKVIVRYGIGYDIAALQSGKIAAAALDVFEQEPLPPENPLRFMPNVITASHIASASPKSVRTLRETAAKFAIMALRGEPLPNIVN